MFVSPLWIMTYEEHEEQKQSFIDFIEKAPREPYNRAFITDSELQNNELFQPLVSTISKISETLIREWELEPHMTQL